MTSNLMLMTRRDERRDENDAGSTEYPLTKLSNLTFHRRLTTCKTHIATMFRRIIKIRKMIKALSSFQ